MESLVIRPEFWKDKRVFVTGHTGFKGSWLTFWLQSMGAKVRGYSLDIPTQPSAFEAMGLNRTCDNTWGDVRDLDQLKKAVNDFSPEIIFHMAAQSLVRKSYQVPVETYATNVMGTVHLLEAGRSCKNLKVVVNVTTDKCYENQELDRGYHEHDPLGGSDPYSSSKACSEIVSSAYRSSFFQKGAVICSARAGNIIGGGDWSEDRLIPDAIRAFAQSKPVLIRNPDSIRPWQHVLDPLRGYLLLAQEAPGGSWNFGPSPSDAATVRQVIDLFTQNWGAGATWHHEKLENQPKESKILKLDPSKAALQLGWSSQLNLAKSVEYSVAWYRKYYAGESITELTRQQLQFFQQTQGRL